MSDANHKVWCLANDWNGSKPCNCDAQSSLAAPAGAAAWVKGEAPLKRILMLWNGKALFGPIAFQTVGHRDLEIRRLIETTAKQIAGAPTHYLIIPKAPMPPNPDSTTEKGQP